MPRDTMPRDNNDDGSDPPAAIMRFPQYRNFPVELRLQIIEEFVKAFDKRRGDRLENFARIDPDWHHVIERVLFSSIKLRNGEVRRFAEYCRERQHVVNSVTLTLSLDHWTMEAPVDLVRNARIIKRNISELFHVLKDWDRSATPRRLLTVFIVLPDRHHGLRNVWATADEMTTITCDFQGLPVVAAIGKLFTIHPPDGLHSIDHSSMDTLHRLLPNLRAASLDLPNEMSVHEKIQIARGRMIATHASKPNLQMLCITQDPTFLPGYASPDFVVRCREDERAIARSLTLMIQLWSNTLVSIKLDCHIDIPQFLSMASKSWWPSLEVMQMAAILDEDEGSETPGSGGLDPEKRYRAPQEALEGLITALPFMRNLVKIDIQFRDPTTGFWACCVCVDLNTRTNPPHLVYYPPRYVIRDYFVRQTAIVPCRCGALTAGPTLVTREVVLPGALLTEFQDAVRQHRQQDLTAWCCRISQLRWGRLTPPFLPCTRWDRDTDCWIFSFLNDMDPFIWRMGHFWHQLDRADFLKELDPTYYSMVLDAEYEADFGL